MKEINVQEHFASQADNYIELMTKLVPNYMEGQVTIIDSIPFEKTKPIKVLDLGCGNGILSQILLKKFPNANIVGFDITSEMLDIYKKKLTSYTNKFETIQGDFKVDDFGSNYDVILSGLTLQHLNSEERQKMYRRVYDSLNDEGIYITRDIIIGENDTNTNDLYNKWIDYMNQCGEDGKMWYEKHRQKDFPETADDLRTWMRETSFKDIELKQQDINFVIISALKK